MTHTPRIRIPSPVDDGAAPRTAALMPSAETHGEDLFSLYAVREKIGDGGMGVVYLARDRKLGRFVAIKRLNARVQAIAQLRRRFLQEARAVAALNHMHIVHIYGLGEDDDGPYIVMEYVPGPPRDTGARLREPGLPQPPLSLDQRVSRQGQLSVPDAIHLLVKIGQAVAYAHENGVIHRDIKPSNILLDPSGEPKIVDFGLARLMREEESKLTVSGEKLLSLGYGAPEQEQDASASDERADVYGLGALLYFAITGQNPRYFRDSDIPTPLREVLSKALATDREKRWPTARAFTEALSALMTQTQTDPQPTVKTTWRCKWCDTVNPLTLRYCGECGWDGGENCAECGQQTFFGVQFCGECGADARAYESMRLVLERMDRCMHKREFEQVLSFAGRTLGFEPAGEQGRGLLKHMQSLREQAERSIARREQLRERIEVELRAENFERAEVLIAEYRALRPDGTGFETEAAKLPSQRAKRDLERARKALRARRWDRAARLCQSLLGGNLPDAHQDACRQLLRRVRLRRAHARIWRWALALGLFGLLYLLVPPPLLRFAPQRSWTTTSRYRLWMPALRIYRLPHAAPLFNRYAAWWGIEQPYERVLSALGTPAPGTEPEPPKTEPVAPALPALEEAFEQEWAALEAAYQERKADWPQAYGRALEQLMDQRREAGDFEGWSDVEVESRRFAETGQIGVPATTEFPELRTLKETFQTLRQRHRLARDRALSTLAKSHVNALLDLQREYTRAGDMDAAAQVNARIRTLSKHPEVIAADARLLALETADDPVDPTALDLTEEEQSAELERIRRDFDARLSAIEAEHGAERERWHQAYVDALETHMEACRTRGDFQGWERTQRERERFTLYRTLVEADVLDEPVGLATLQKRQLQTWETIEDQRAAAVVSATKQVLQRLTRRLTRLTKAGDMDNAARINAEIRRVRAQPHYAEAQARLDAARNETEAEADNADP